MQDFSINNRRVNVLDGEATEEYSVKYPSINKTLLLLFCGYVVAWYLQIGYRIPVLGDIRFEFIYALVLTVLAFLATPKIDTKCPLLPYVLLYFLVIVIQVPFSHDFARSWDVFVDRIVKFAFMAFFIVSFVRSPSHMKYFLGAFLLACLKMGQEGLVGRLSGGLIWENQGIMRLHGPTPIYGHPNSFAGMAMGTLPFVYFLWPLSNKYIKAVLLVIGILSLHIVLYTGSRTAYVGIFAFVAFAFYTTSNKKRFIGCMVLALALSLPMVPSDYQERFRSIFTLEEKEGRSSEARIQIIEDAWKIFTDNPFGVGVSAFPKVRAERFGRSQDTHNMYLEIATNLGIQGIIVVGMMIYKMLGILHYIRTKSKLLLVKLDSNDSLTEVVNDLKLVEAIASSIIGFIILRLTLGLFGMDLYEIYWWFAIGITFSLYSMLIKIENSLIAKNDSAIG
ncbi:O-antigen ligase family protein [Geobacter anodireducens]|uniref:Polymerase n=1 Tax=Geobacter soli TaxID=1510391 RepID=A0A0C1QV08_9BACT|nr:O-antigen ligase family protein [Geobacter soli]ANA40115.1 polymerase [Geobacter anodireducens]KIE42006.1 polymerase [Geobacter soli]